MANHVSNYITMSCNNDACQKEWDKLFVSYGEEVERPSYHGDGTIKIWEWHEIQKHPFMSGYTDDNWYSWGIDNIGAKWAHIEDADDYHAYIVSAWSPVFGYLEKLYDHLVKFDSEVDIRCQYEDEFRNFIGVWQNTNYEEIDGDDLTSQFEEQYKVDLSSEDFDWSDVDKETDTEYDQLFDDLVYNWFEECQV